jgi:hypothetical protein
MNTDTRPQLFRETLRTRPTIGDILPPLLGVIGAGTFLFGIVTFLVWMNSI